MTRQQATIAVGAICAGALALRVTGIGYGLPAVYNQDEVAIMNRAMAFGTGDLNPHNFLYPTLYFYLLFAWEGLYFIVGRIGGTFHSLAEFQRQFFQDPSGFFIAGRWLTALCGTLTVWATYRLTTRLADRTAGVIAAALLAVAPFAVRDAHYVKHDVPVTLLIVLTHVVLAGIVADPARRERAWSWVLAGALAGLAMSMHYYAVFVALPMAIVALRPTETDASLAHRARWLLVAGLTAAVAFAVTSPFVLLEPATALRDMAANRRIVMDRVVGDSGAFASLSRYVGMMWSDAGTRLIFLGGALGSVIVFARRPIHGVMLLAFTLPFFLFLTNTFPASRYLNPVLPFLAAAAAATASFYRSPRTRFGAMSDVLFVLLLAVPAAVSCIQVDQFFRQTDTRTLAQQFIEREIPGGASILVQPYSVQLRRTRASIVEGLRAHGIDENEASPKFRHQLDLTPYPSPAYRTIYLGAGGMDADLIYVPPPAFSDAGGLEPLRTLAVEYVVLKRYNVANESLRVLDAALQREAQLMATFSPYRTNVSPERRLKVAPFEHNTDASMDAALERPGPIIEIWHIK